jgi:hypothetical protein
VTTDPAADLIGAVRRSPNGTRLAILWPSPPHPARWMVTDRWGSTGYETDESVADWPIVGAVPYSPAAGMELAEIPTPARQDSQSAKAAALSASPEAWQRLGNALRESREHLRMSRRLLSEKADVSEKSIQIAEEGRVPSARWPQSISRITQALGWEPGAAIRIVLAEDGAAR